MSRRVLIGLTALLGAGCAAGAVGGSGVPLPGGGDRPEDRVILGDFATVQAIASSFDRVYVVYREGIGIWQPLQRQWDAPRAAPSLGALDRVFAALVDPLDRTLWLAAREGVIHFDPFLQRWDATPIPGGVVTLASDPKDPAGGVWVRSGAGWFQVPRIGAPTPGSPPAAVRAVPTLEDAYRDIPMLRTASLELTLGARMEVGRLTAAAPDPSGTGWYIGTSLRGAFLVDRVGARATPLSLGLPGAQVGAVALDANGVWVATDDDFRQRPAALSYVATDLSGTRTIEGDPAFGLGLDAVRRIVLQGDTLWLASDRGVRRMRTDGQDEHRWDEGDGLPDQRAIALAPWRGGMAVGTLRGIAVIDRAGVASRPMPGMAAPVYALLAHADTLWIGTDRGLEAHRAGTPDPLPLPEWDRHLGSARPVLGLGSVGDTLVAMTDSDLHWRDPATGRWQVGPILGGGLGRLRAFFATPDGAWIGGDRGAAFVQLAGGTLETLLVGRDLPEAVTAIVADRRYLWIGTLRGLVRITLRGG